jgi:hypothetical protein
VNRQSKKKLGAPSAAGSKNAGRHVATVLIAGRPGMEMCPCINVHDDKVFTHVCEQLESEMKGEK